MAIPGYKFDKEVKNADGSYDLIYKKVETPTVADNKQDKTSDTSSEKPSDANKQKDDTKNTTNGTNVDSDKGDANKSDKGTNVNDKDKQPDKKADVKNLDAHKELGQLVDKDGKILANAKITFKDANGKTVELMTDENGLFDASEYLKAGVTDVKVFDKDGKEVKDYKVKAVSENVADLDNKIKEAQKTPTVGWDKGAADKKVADKKADVKTGVDAPVRNGLLGLGSIIGLIGSVFLFKRGK